MVVSTNLQATGKVTLNSKAHIFNQGLGVRNSMICLIAWCPATISRSTNHITYKELGWEMFGCYHVRQVFLDIWRMDKTNILGHLAYEDIYIYNLYIAHGTRARTRCSDHKKVNFFARAVYPLTAPTRNTGPAGLSSSAKYSSSAYTPPKLSIEQLV